jgi:AcrR family transcriptional regulator
MANVSRASSAARRRDLVAAAKAEMVASGTAAVAYTAVAARCGVSTTTLYRRFETRSDLLEAVVEEHVAAPVLAWTEARHTVLSTTTGPDRARRAAVRLEPTTRTVWNLLLVDAAWPTPARGPVAGLLRRSAALVDADPDDPSTTWRASVAVGVGSWLLATGLGTRPPPAFDEVVALRPRARVESPSAPVAAPARPHVPDPRGRRLLAVAARRLAEVGYDAMGVDDVVGRARTSTGALYNRFSGKPGLLAECLLARHGAIADGDAEAAAVLVEALRVAPTEPEVGGAVAATVGLRRRTLVRDLRAGSTGPARPAVAASTRAWVQIALPIGQWVLRRTLADPGPFRTPR